MSGRLWFDHGEPSQPWSSFGIALAATAALFAGAFASMVSRRPFMFGETTIALPDLTPRERMVVVTFSAPVSAPRLLGVSAPRRSAPKVAVPLAPPTEPSPMVRDTTATARPDSVVRSTETPATIPPVAAASSARRAVVPANPAAGVTNESRSGPLSDAQKKAFLDSVIAANPWVLPPQTPWIPAPPRRTGESSVGGGVKIPFPIFEPGPSREQRRRDSIVHADNMARLERLKARADSLRRDSLAKRKP